MTRMFGVAHVLVLGSFAVVACGGVGRDLSEARAEQQGATVNGEANAVSSDGDHTSSGTETPPVMSAVPALAEPVAGVSKRAKLPNGDTLTIPLDDQLVERQGIDSIVGVLLDASGTQLCLYDIGPFGVNLDERTGTRDQSANQVFFYSEEPPGADGFAGIWQATFRERGPVAFTCQYTLTRAEFLGLMRTYMASSEPPFGG
jgi:hypothetical protein